MRGNEETIPGAGEGLEAISPALAVRFDGVRARLEALAAAPPQVLLLEGGNSSERFAMSMWWGARLNCRQPGPPCLACPVCLQVAARMHRDLFVLDGREGNISIDAVREVRGLLGEPPRGDGTRVIILAEAQSLGEPAANALLKSLEEPRPSTSFMLLAPQRERLLPTLVSRSWVLTLPWPVIEGVCRADIEPWLSALAGFAESGRGWFDKTGARGAVDAALATEIVLACERVLLTTLAGRDGGVLGALLGARLSPEGLATLDEVLAHCSEALALQPSPTNPSLVLDWLATRLYLLLRRRPRS